MSQEYCILNLLNIKDKNIKLVNSFYEETIYKKVKTNVIEAKLSYEPHHCDRCGCIYDEENTYEKNGFSKPSFVRLIDSGDRSTLLKLKKQRYLCHVCGKKFFAKTSLVNKHCYISNITKQAIALRLGDKISEKDIAKRYRVSPNTVERIIDSYYENQKLYKHYLPEVLLFDEFKSVKSADGAMSFHMCDGRNGKTIDIVEDRKLTSLIKYFSYYTHKARSNVKLIVIDMYSPYISLIKAMFPNAEIIIDKFHIVNLISTSLNKTRIKMMKESKKNYKKLKRYWKLLLKSQEELDNSKWKKYKCFKDMMTQGDVVNYLVNTSTELKETYDVYQTILYAIKKKDFELLKTTLLQEHKNVSEYMITSINTLISYLGYIKNTLQYNYHNGYIEGNHNFIKTLKRVAFGYRSFVRFKARIMICKNLLHMKKVNAF